MGGLPEGANPIFVLEIAAAAYAIMLARTVFGPKTNIVAFTDNNPALCATLRDCTGCDAATRFIKRFWQYVDAGRLNVWLGRIRSCRNLADAPSRGVGPFEQVHLPFIDAAPV